MSRTKTIRAAVLNISNVYADANKMIIYPDFANALRITSDVLMNIYFEHHEIGSKMTSERQRYFYYMIYNREGFALTEEQRAYILGILDSVGCQAWMD